jgi:hypothetical protein
MRTRLALLAILALVIFSASAAADRKPGRLYDLRRYAGQIAVDDTIRPRRNLLKLPELREPLTALLGKRYERLLRAFYLQSPIEVVNGMNGRTARRFSSCSARGTKRGRWS